MPYALASGFFRPGSREASAILQLPARPRRPLPRARALRAAHRRHEPGLPETGHRRRLRHERRALPRRQRPARAAPAQPLRQARRGDDAEHLRLRRGLDGRPGQRAVLPLDAPAAEQRQQRLLPRDAAADARPRDHRLDGPAARPRARVLDAAGLARAGQADRRARAADELRAAHLHDRLGCRRGARPARRAHGLHRPAAAPAAAAERPAHRGGHGQRHAPSTAHRGTPSPAPRRSTSRA